MTSKEKTQNFVDFLFRHQEETCEEVNNGEDVQVFNVIGTVIGLISAEYITYTGAFDLISLLSISNEAKERVYKVYFNALEHANKEDKGVFKL